MSPRTTTKQAWHLASVALRDAYTDFILSLRAGMDVLHLQAMLGHEGLEMTRHYVQVVDDDLLREHRAHSSVDWL
jgi:site-specific recombinase XerD